ncbi:MAG TPA: FAD binding domain-containing protein [Pseudonocardia sp.]|nr:FAD binding domain-containing protein [Pseudonocardia sp.]
MKCAPFEYVRAGSVEEAVATLGQAGDEGKVLAGGQSLVPVLALRLARPSVLVDVNRVPGLDGLTPDGEAVRVGALVRHAALAMQPHHPLLAEAARWIGHAAIRTRGTFGGSLAHADPSAELPVVAVATGATVHLSGRQGSRSLDAEDLFDGALVTTLADDELITAADVPVPDRWGFAEFARRHGDFALVTAVVAQVRGTWRIALGGVGPVPVRATAAEAALASGAAAHDVGAAAAAQLTPTGDLHGSPGYRRGLAAELVRRAVVQATG